MSSFAGTNRKKSTSTSSSKKVGVTSPARKSSIQGGAVNHTSQARIKEPSKNMKFHFWWGTKPRKKKDWKESAVTSIQECRCQGFSVPHIFWCAPRKKHGSIKLEQQVSDLKRRLDELRKAKNTIIRKDKEYVTTGVPHNVLNSMSTGSGGDCPEACKLGAGALYTECEFKVQRSNQEVKALHENIAAMKEMHRAELQELKTEVERQAKQSESSFASELEKLKKQNRELQEENEVLTSKTVHLQLRIDDLLEELSKKEAEWCSKEEKLILEVKTSWGEKYQKWMAQTEQKIEELQTANNFLKMLLEKERPDKN